MSGEPPVFRIMTDGEVDKVQLKELAIELDVQLKKDALLSKDIAAFAAYPPLVSAIQRAKEGLVEIPEELPNMQYWYFETELGDFKKFDHIGNLVAGFNRALKGWRMVLGDKMS